MLFTKIYAIEVDRDVLRGNSKVTESLLIFNKHKPKPGSTKHRVSAVFTLLWVD